MYTKYVVYKICSIFLWKDHTDEYSGDKKLGQKTKTRQPI